MTAHSGRKRMSRNCECALDFRAWHGTPGTLAQRRTRRPPSLSSGEHRATHCSGSRVWMVSGFLSFGQKCTALTATAACRTEPRAPSVEPPRAGPCPTHGLCWAAAPPARCKGECGTGDTGIFAGRFSHVTFRVSPAVLASAASWRPGLLPARAACPRRHAAGKTGYVLVSLGTDVWFNLRCPLTSLPSDRTTEEARSCPVEPLPPAPLLPSPQRRSRLFCNVARGGPGSWIWRRRMPRKAETGTRHARRSEHAGISDREVACCMRGWPLARLPLESTRVRGRYAAPTHVGRVSNGGHTSMRLTSCARRIPRRPGRPSLREWAGGEAPRSAVSASAPAIRDQRHVMRAAFCARTQALPGGSHLAALPPCMDTWPVARLVVPAP